jgi:hypothetical protein
MKNKNKFIPIAILAGLCILAVSMCNERCNKESVTTEYSASSDTNGNKSETKIKRTKKGRRNCKKGNCYKK